MTSTDQGSPGSSEATVGATRPAAPAEAPQPLWQVYALAATLTAAAVVLYAAVTPQVAAAPAVILFVIPIILSAYVGGLGPGLLSTVVALLGTDYLLLLPTHTFEVPPPVDAVRWLALIPVGVLVSVLSEALHRSRRRAEAARDALRESEDRFRRERALLRALIDSIPDLIFFKDTRSVYLGCNKAFEVYSGVPEAALVGKTDLDLTSPDVAEMYRRADREMLASTQVWRGEEWIPFQNGGGGYFDTLKTPYYGPEGDVLGLIGVSRNISERKQAEEQLRLQAAALESAANGIVIADRTGAIQWINAAFTKLTGYTAAEALGHNPRLLKSGRHDAAFYESLWDTISAGRVWHGEVVNKRKDGTLYTEEMIITPVRASGGEISHFVAIKQDITDRVRSEEARVQLEAQLHAAQKMEALGTLAGGVAHDFNNILGAIIGNVELAAQDVDPGHPAMMSLDEIRKASRRGKDLVQRILAFGRQHGQLHRVITLGPIVEAAVESLRATLPAGGQLSTTLAADTPTVLADAMQIEQVLLNLGTNACHALTGPVRRIDIRLEGIKGITLDREAADGPATLRPGRWARLTVADTGTGMDSATLERVFEPFFTTKPPGEGTGLGLSIVHSVVKAHGGAVKVDSEPGRGTTVALYLPAASASNATGTPDHAGSNPPASTGAQHGRDLDADEARQPEQGEGSNGTHPRDR